MQEVQTILPIGSVIRERYVVESLLGKGGFGVVYRVIYASKAINMPSKKSSNRTERTAPEKKKSLYL